MPDIKRRGYDSLDGLNRNQWNNLVNHSEDGSIFHAYEWSKAIIEGIGLEPHIVVAEKDGNPVGILPNYVRVIDVPIPSLRSLLPKPKMLVSISPGFGGPILTSPDEDILDLLFKSKHSDLGLDVIFHQIRGYDLNNVKFAHYLQDLGYVPHIYSCRFQLSLDNGYDVVIDNIHRSKRRTIEKASDDELRVEIDALSDGNFDEFYDYYRDTVDRVGGDPYPIDFFEELAIAFEDDVLLIAAKQGNETVGYHLYLEDHYQDTFHHFATGVPETYLDLSPAVIIHDAAIRYAIDSELTLYDFGATPADYRDGLFRFKSEWGGDLTPLIAWERGYSRLFWGLYRFGRKYFGK